MAFNLTKNLGFSSLGLLGSNLINITVMLILARILSPEDFGILAIISVISVFANLIIDGGMGAALIHRQNVSEIYYVSTFWFNVLVGVIITILIGLVFPRQIANFFNIEILSKVISVTAWLFVINSFAVVPFSLLQKGQNFSAISKVELLSVTFGAVGAITLANLGFGVWSLIAQLFIRDIFRIILLYYYSRWLPKLQFSYSCLKTLFSYSCYLIIGNYFSSFIQKLDLLLVAKFLGVNEVGVYSYSTKIATVVPSIGIGVVNRVLFPYYSSRNMDLAFLKDQYLKSIAISSMIFMPLMLFISVEAEDLVMGILGGEKWQEMITPLSFLAIAYMLRTIAGLNGPVFMSLGKTKLMMYMAFLMRGNVMIAMLIGIQFGMQGILWAMILVRVINLIPALYFPMSLLGTTTKELLDAMIPPLFAVMIFAILITMISVIMNVIENPLLEMMIVFVITFSIYGVAVYFSIKKGFLQCLR